MAQEWTDGRLDDLNVKVDRGFEQVDQRFDRIEREIVNLRVETRTEFNQLRGEMKEGFARIDERLDSMQRTMIQAVIAMTGATLAGFGGMIVLISTQL